MKLIDNFRSLIEKIIMPKFDDALKSFNIRTETGTRYDGLQSKEYYYLDFCFKPELNWVESYIVQDKIHDESRFLFKMLEGDTSYLVVTFDVYCD